MDAPIYAPDQCPKCGKYIGLLARVINLVITLHKYEKPDRILVDREGVAYLPVTEVILRGKKKK